MKRSDATGIATAVAAGMAAWTAPATAEVYFGASAGTSQLEASENYDGAKINVDSDDTAYKLFGGYMFNEYVGVEISYIDMGSLDDNIGFDGGEAGPFKVGVNADITGFAGALVLQYPFGPVDVFGKAGVVQYDIDGHVRAVDANGVTQFSESASDDGNELIYGVGARYNFGQFGVRVEYEAIDADDIDEASMYSIGAEYSF